jgi:hypothetical protein
LVLKFVKTLSAIKCLWNKIKAWGHESLRPQWICKPSATLEFYFPAVEVLTPLLIPIFSPPWGLIQLDGPDLC